MTSQPGSSPRNASAAVGGAEIEHGMGPRSTSQNPLRRQLVVFSAFSLGIRSLHRYAKLDQTELPFTVLVSLVGVSDALVPFRPVCPFRLREALNRTPLENPSESVYLDGCFNLLSERESETLPSCSWAPGSQMCRHLQHGNGVVLFIQSGV